MSVKTFSAWGRSWGRSWGNAWGNITGADTHDGGDYYIKWWRKQHEKKPTTTQIIQLIQENPEAALKAIPEVKTRFAEIDYAKIKTDAKIQEFLAKKILILIQIQARKQQLEEEEEQAIEMLLLW